MTTHLFDSHDREYLAELMRDFPVSSEISLDRAIERIKDICNNYLRAEKIAEKLKRSPDDVVTIVFQRLPIALHKRLFDGILSNAGEYRKEIDPNGGEVLFGPPRNEFKGTEPENIAQMLTGNIATLTPNSFAPVDVAARFYQRFVYIHPFHDGNGRIARLIVEIYLLYHHFQIDFEHLRKTTRWLKQLNYCHRKMNIPQAYPHSLKWWVHHFRKFVVSESELL